MSVIVDLLPVFMFGALVGAIFLGMPVAVTLISLTVLFGAFGLATGDIRFIQLTLLPNRIFGGAIENPALVAVPLFIFMGMILERTGIAEDLLISLQRLLAFVPGGLALSVVLVGAILAASTGIIGASVVTLTSFALPTLLKRGYAPTLAAGTIAAAGTLGIMIPPSIMLVFIGDLLGLNLARLFAATLVPGLILALAYGLYVFGVALLRPDLAPAAEIGDAPDAPPIGPALVWPFVLIIAVLGSIIGGWATPTEAAAVGAGTALLIAGLRGRMSLAVMAATLERTVLTLAMLFFIFIAATAFAYVFRKLGGDDYARALSGLAGGGDWGVLATFLFAIFLLGFVLDWFEISLVVLPIFAPIVGGLDFAGHVESAAVLYWFVVLIALNFQTSFLTPPIGATLFYMKGTAGDLLTTRALYLGVIPFVALQLLVIGVVLAFPEVALWLPEKLFD